MSASSKKKLRNAQEAEKLTEKQLKEQAEAKKLKTHSTIFVVVIALMVCFAVYTAVSNTVEHSGIFERNTFLTPFSQICAIICLPINNIF